MQVPIQVQAQRLTAGRMEKEGKVSLLSDSQPIDNCLFRKRDSGTIWDIRSPHANFPRQGYLAASPQSMRTVVVVSSRRLEPLHDSECGSMS